MATHRQDFPHLVINRDSPAHARNLVEKSRGLEGNTEEATTTDAEPSPAGQFVSLQQENMHLREQVQALNEEVAVLKGKLGGRQNGHGGVAESQGKEAERALLVAHPPTSQVVALEAQLQASQSEKKYFQALIEEKQGVIARLQKRVEEQDKTPHASAGLVSRMGPWPGRFDDVGEGRGAREERLASGRFDDVGEGSGAREERLARAATEAVAEVSQGAHGKGGKVGGRRSVEAPHVAGRNAGTREQVEPVDARTFVSRAESMTCPPLSIVGVGREGVTGGGTDPGRGGGREEGRGEGGRAHELLSLEGRDILTDELYEEMQRHKYNHPRLIIRACLDCLVPLFKVPSTAGALADFRAFFEGQRSIHTRAEEVLGNLRKGEGMSAPELDCLQRVFEVVVPPAAREPREEEVTRLEGEGRRDEEFRRGGSAQAGVRRRRKDFMRELVTAMNAFHGIKNKKPDLAYMCARAGVEARGLDTVEALQSGLKDHVALQQAFVQICAAMPPGQLSCNRRYVARKLFEFCGLDASVLVAKKGLQGRKPPSRKGMRSGEGGGGRKRKVEAVEELVRVDRPRRQRKRRRWWGEEEEEEGEEEEEEEGRKEGEGGEEGEGGREGGRGRGGEPANFDGERG
ncbi:hypothetical protein NSK_001245 [Nannochloropsis salina CCMP1776]|uniref:Uncharacterized protein n=1 Tax=Nannochloropsis salina CCMP1776 TaxID=1027361 RepID=A0A4D9DGH7_9STRA|nr:hypothetical protein NSK_001245 [Nannochloropsis salina CCMP1776]|eukprot:TFJ87899.1 hypothetical protein NSK_001245 [Nannochloropsis salina CCMP1776]